MPQSHPYTVGSLYSGIGGLDLGFERAGFAIRWQIELDEFCTRALARHWPEVHRERDVRTVRWRTLEPVDVIVAGFPCQDVSDAGTREGLGGDRSWLWWHVRRAARVLRPAILVVENVRGLLVRGLPTVLGSLARIGYDAEWTVVRASDVGAPHRRARVFILAYPESRGQRILGGAALARHDRHPDSEDASGGRLADAVIGRCEWRSDGEGQRPSSGNGAQADGGRRLAHADSTRLEGPDLAALADARAWRQHRDPARSTAWPARPGEPQHAWEPPRCLESAVGTDADGLPRRLAGWRRASLEAIGNAVCPQVAELVAYRVRERLGGLSDE